ncbi:MAG: hypothetical protein WCJ91_02355 [Actinomycetes bacterium]
MLVEERGNVESFLVLVPLTLLFLGVLTLLLFLQIRISALGVAMRLAREVSLSVHHEESESVARSKLQQVGVKEPITISFENRSSVGLQTVVVIIKGRTAVGIPISLEVTAVVEQ